MLVLEWSVPWNRWNFVVNQNRGRLQYYGAWDEHFDARSVRGADTQPLKGRHSVDLEANVTLTRSLTFALSGQNVFNTLLERMDLSADIFGLPTASSRRWV